MYHYGRPGLGSVRSGLTSLMAGLIIIENVDEAMKAAEPARAPQRIEGYDADPIKCCSAEVLPQEPAWRQEQRNKHRSAFRRR
jgi:hypothetical protein